MNCALCGEKLLEKPVIMDRPTGVGFRVQHWTFCSQCARVMKESQMQDRRNLNLQRQEGVTTLAGDFKLNVKY